MIALSANAVVMLLDVDHDDSLGVLGEEFEHVLGPGRSGRGGSGLLAAGREREQGQKNDDPECGEFFHKNILLFILRNTKYPFQSSAQE